MSSAPGGAWPTGHSAPETPSAPRSGTTSDVLFTTDDARTSGCREVLHF